MLWPILLWGTSNWDYVLALHTIPLKVMIHAQQGMSFNVPDTRTSSTVGPANYTMGSDLHRAGIECYSPTQKTNSQPTVQIELSLLVV